MPQDGAEVRSGSEAVSDDADEPSDDPDRAAILARRRRFIALALSGLAGTAACDRDGRPTSQPQPCLKTAAPTDTPGPTDATPTDTTPTNTTPTDTTPTDTTPEPPPQPCLEVATPQPCLEVAPPQACLKVAPPQACLDVAPPPASPTPCLDVGPPQPPQPLKPPPKPKRPKIELGPQVCLMIAESASADDDDDD